MKYLLVIVLLVSGFLVNGQTSFLKDAAKKLDRALVMKDTVTLKLLLHSDLTYGHSNGWVETRADVIKDLISGKLVYNKIESSDARWITGKNWASVRSKTEIKYVMDGKEGDLNLHVLQVWLKTNRGWQLLARQSTKL